MSFILNPSRFSAGGADPGLTLLESATLWLDASDAVSGAQWLRNKGTGGRALDARVGSVGSAQIINGALKLNGVNGNYASTPDASALDLTGDCELVARLAPLDWTPAANMRIICKRNSASIGNYELMLDPTGALGFSNASNGGNPTLSSTSVPFSDGTAGWVKVTYRNSDRRVQFFTAADSASEPVSFTQLGTDATHTAGGAVADTYALCIGGIGASFNPFNGTIFRAIVRNGIGGTTVFDADFTAQSTLVTSFTESSSNAATVTINSTTGVDTNDPLLLPHTGTNYLYLPGAASNFASTPDAAALDITGDIEMIVRVTIGSTSTTQALISKWQGTASSSCYYWRLESGNIAFYYTADGSTAGATRSYVVAHGRAVGETVWLRMTRVQSTGVIEFLWAADQSTVPSSWTSLGSEVNSTEAMFSGTAQLRVGMDADGGNPLNGSVFRAIVRSTIGGSAVFDADFTANTNQSSFTESSSNAATVTINRSTSGRKAVMVVRPTLLFGTDDYLEVADNAAINFAAGDDFTLLVVGRQHATPASFQTIVAKRLAGTAGNPGWFFGNNGTAFDVYAQLQGGTSGVPTDVTGASWSAGERRIIGMIRDAGVTLYSVLDNVISAGSSDTSVGTLSNTSALRIGRDTAGSGPAPYADMEIEHVLLFPAGTMLNTTQLGQIKTYLGV